MPNKKYFIDCNSIIVDPLNFAKSSKHPHGIKVMLEGGIVGRVKEML